MLQDKPDTGCLVRFIFWDFNASRHPGDETGNSFQYGRFPGSVFTGQCMDFSWRNCKIKVINDRNATVP
jgi:hypothetical protein